jgi:single-stranded-DNA-specific exonuclease
MIRPVFLLRKELIRLNNLMNSKLIIPEIDEEIVSELSRNSGIERPVVSILYSRGYRTYGEIYRFLYPELTDMHSPFLMKGVYEALHLIRKHIDIKSKIAIFADSDLDGITSLTIIYDLLSRLGNTPSIRYPKNKEGYGLTCDIIEEFINKEINLIITVDSGIRDIEEIKMARANGIDVIITDHHEPDSVIPDAVIVNPRQKDCLYPFKDLAGVGVAFKLAHALLFSYISGFDNRFIITIKHKEGYEFSYILNGCVSGQEAVRNKDITEYISKKISGKDYFILYDDDPEFVQLLKSFYSDIKIKHITEIYSGTTETDFKNISSDLDEIIKHYKINPLLSNSRMDLACRIFLETQLRSSKKIFSLLEQYLVLVSIGTIADIMPMHNENRQMIKYGISLLSRGEGHYGINSLVNSDQVNTKSISWGVAPLLNSPGRFGETDLTVNFFLEKDIRIIADITADIQKLNRERKKIVSEIIFRVKEKISEEGSSFYGNIYLYHDDDIIDGIAGLVANRIADELKKPVIVATGSDENGLLKGSGRSPGGFNFFNYVEPFAEDFEKLGGHAQAFGFTIKREKLHEIVKKISQLIGDEISIDHNIKIDCLLEIDEINNALLDKLELIEPYGKNNEEPLFYTPNVEITSFACFGSENKHGKFVLKNGITAIGWNIASEMREIFSNITKPGLLYKIEKNTYLNRTSPRIIIVEMKS